MKEFFIAAKEDNVVRGYVGDEPICVGDWLGGSQVVKIALYDKFIDEAGPGGSCCITFDYPPETLIRETTDKQFIEWVKRMRLEVK